MSLAALLAMGKKDGVEEKPKPPKPKPETKVEEVEEPKPPPPTMNTEDLKFALELREKQADQLEEEMAMREAEEEAEKEHAKQRKAKAEQEARIKAMQEKSAAAAASPFTSGGRAFTPGVFVCDERAGVNKPQGAVSFLAGVSDGWPGLPMDIHGNVTGTQIPAAFQGGQPQFRQLVPPHLQGMMQGQQGGVIPAAFQGGHAQQIAAGFSAAYEAGVGGPAPQGFSGGGGPAPQGFSGGGTAPSGFSGGRERSRSPRREAEQSQGWSPGSGSAGYPGGAGFDQPSQGGYPQGGFDQSAQGGYPQGGCGYPQGGCGYPQGGYGGGWGPGW